MRLYENESKKLFQIQGIPIPVQYGTISSVDDLKVLRNELKFPLMLKSLILTGGRGKAGGIKKVNNLDDTFILAEKMLVKKIRGYSVQNLMLEQAVEEKESCYLGVIMNPANFNNTLIASLYGGTDIEQIAKENPESILKIELPGNDPILSQETSNEIVEFVLREKSTANQFTRDLKKIVSKVYTIYQNYDCKIIEINPLIITREGPVAADAKIVLDDNALYRQAELLELLGIKKIRHDISEPTENEIRAQEAGFPYIDLLPENYKKDPDKLYIGLVPGGAGYGIFMIDETANIGSRFFDDRVVPVNFMDSGGDPPFERVVQMFHLLMDYSIVDLIITSRFGGISSCDTFIRGLVECIRKRRKKGNRIVPVYGRIVGTDLPDARDFLEESKRETPNDLKEMYITVGNRIIMADIIRKSIQKMFEKS